MPRVIRALEEISAGYDVLFCDIWGCLHDGVAIYPRALDALGAFRKQGGVVVLLTNAPRPACHVEAQLRALGAWRAQWDAVVSSGEATRRRVQSGRFGRKVWLLGPDRDRGLIAGLPVAPVPPDEADFILCSGLHDDERETPSDYESRLREARARDLLMIVANPDLAVHRGAKTIPCAGALARRYAQMGGRTVWFGKPYPEIYDLARETAAEIAERETEKARILAIGDGATTDMRGAEGQGIDALFVAGGLHRRETGTRHEVPDRSRLADFFALHNIRPVATIGRLC